MESRLTRPQLNMDKALVKNALSFWDVRACPRGYWSGAYAIVENLDDSSNEGTPAPPTDSVFGVEVTKDKRERASWNSLC